MKRVGMVALLLVVMLLVELIAAPMAMAANEPSEVEAGESAKQQTEGTTIWYTEADVIMLAKLIFKEAGNKESTTMERAAVVWCVLNRVDDKRWPDTIYKVVTQRHQFAYNKYVKKKYYAQYLWLARDVLERWVREKNGEIEVGRVLPKAYVYFAGYRRHNRFRKVYRAKCKADYWDWSLPNPYDK